MQSAMIFFSTVTLIAPALVAAGALWGGIWAFAGLIWMTAIAATMDEMIAFVLPTQEDTAEFPRADTLSVLLALSQFALIGLVVAALGGATGLVAWEKLAVFAGAALFAGQVGNSNAHELIHRSSRFLRRLGMWVYISVLFGHHTSAHTLVHHIHVGTKADPNSARWGEGLYRFALRAWIGSFRAAFRAETDRLRRANRPLWRHPFGVYIGGAIAMLGIAFWIGGAEGLIGYMCLAGFAQFQLMMSDYVQHYGLRRLTGPDGRLEPVRDRHSWNAPHWFSSALMLNAPRHSDHHAHPNRPYPALRLTDDMPQLPWALPVMACIALYPRLWRKVMDPRVAEWQPAAE